MGTVVEYPTPRSRWGGSGYIPVAVQKSLSAQTLRKRILRPYFEAFKAKMMALYPPVPNTGTVVYIDPTSATNGAGTFGDPKNAMPTTLVDNTTYLFKERTRIVTNYYMVSTTAIGLVYGTYSALDGSRVFEPDRLATIDGATYDYAAVRWRGTTGTFTLSGLRIIGATSASPSQGICLFLANSAGSSSVVTVEHCVFEAPGAYALVPNVTGNLAIAITGPRAIVRFNRICAPADGVAVSPAAGAGYVVLCNDITVAAETAAQGPDCVQVSRQGTQPVGKQIVVGNWMNNVLNQKQAFILNGGTSPASGEEMLFARNMCFGVVDPVARPPMTPLTAGSIAYVSVCESAAEIVGNHFDGWCGWAGVPSNSLIAYNTAIIDHAGFLADEWYVGFEAKAGSTGVVIANNTVIGTNRSAAPSQSNNRGILVGGSGNIAANNVIVGMTLCINGTHTETSNLFSACLPRDTSNNPLALGSGSASIADPMLDTVGRPLPNSPVAVSAGAVTWNGSQLRRDDIFGQSSWATLSNFGAAQGWMNT